jgi:Uma2 family endonuclease
MAMSSTMPKALIAVEYEHAAREYLRKLPLEHFMEALGQSTQREITLESLALLKARRADVQVFNELLVQYPIKGERRKIGQVVPDNMVVLSDAPVLAKSSFNYPLESARPFWMLEYVSNSNKRKDYFDNFDKYEKDLKVPYFLMFYPDDQELTLYHHTGKKYVSVKPNRRGRLEIPELELEIALLDGWVRYWYRGELLPLPGEMQREMDKAREVAIEANRLAVAERQRADAEKRRADEQTQQAAQYQRQLEEIEKELQQLREGRRGNGTKPNKRS